MENKRMCASPKAPQRRVSLEETDEVLKLIRDFQHSRDEREGLCKCGQGSSIEYEYSSLKAHNLSNLMENLKERVDKGWEPFGNPFTVPNYLRQGDFSGHYFLTLSKNTPYSVALMIRRRK